MKHLVWAGLLILEISCPATAGDAGGALQHWAIVCSRELQETALGDLLAVELSKATGLELVNRDALAKIGTELELAQLFDAAGAEGRLKLGRTVRADALVLVRRNGDHPKAPLLLIVAECNQGARLHQQEVLVESDAAAASQIAKIVLAIRRRFPYGISRLFGVPDFLSRNLTHDYDPLQGRYANLLCAALSLDEGVAVLEIEEARSIRKELAGGELGARHVPLVVEGEFRTDALPGSAPPTVNLRVQLVGDKSSQTVESPKLVMAKVPQWIASDLARQVLGQAGGRQSLTADAQIRLLIARAGEFAQLGDFRQAIRLREAVLLVQPSLLEQRLKLFEECVEALGHDELLLAYYKIPDRSVIRQECKRQVDLYLQAMEHLEYVIRNREVERSRAVELITRLSQSFQHGVSDPVLAFGKHRGDHIGREELARAQPPRRRFYLEVVPRILEMPARPGRPQDPLADRWFVEDWQRVFLEEVACRNDGYYLMASDLADLVRVYTKILPDGLPLVSLGLPRPYYLGPGGATPKDYVAFYRELAESNHKTASLRGRFMLLQCQFNKARGKAEGGPAMLSPFEKRLTLEVGQSLLDQVRKLRADYRALPRLANMPSPERDSGWHDLAVLEEEIENSLHPERRQRMLANDPTTQVERTTGALRFTPVPLVIRQLDGTVETHPDPNRSPGTPRRFESMNVVRCGPTTDVFWHWQGLYVMRQAGSMDELLHTKSSLSDLSHSVRQVVWDGRQLWVAKADGAVWIVATDGTVQAKVDTSCGLPPARQGVFVCPIEGGRVVALGSFGDPPRAWAATITYVGDKATVHIFFEAKNAPPAGPRLRGRDAIDIGFGIGQGSIHAYQPQGVKGRPLLLVQRAFAFPLQVNLETFAVSILQFTDERHATHETFWYSRDGVLLTGASARIGLRAPQGQPWPDGKLWRPIPLSNPPAPNADYDDTKTQEMLRYLFDNGSHPSVIDSEDGYIYYFGQFCYRINPSTWTANRLTSTGMPCPYDTYCGFGVSAYYGMTAWTQGTLYQITIDEAAIPPAGGPIAK